MEGGKDRERIRKENEFARIREAGYWKVLGSGNHNWTEGIRREGSTIKNLAGFR
jgi:hypothetical protein